MGQIKVKGNAKREVAYDYMKISVKFDATEQTMEVATGKVMKECEEFLGIMKECGIDITKITLESDGCGEDDVYNHVTELYETRYEAFRKLELKTPFDMKLANEIRIVISKMGSSADYHLNYELSNENDIMHELYIEALQNAKIMAEQVAAAVNQKVVGLLSSSVDAPYEPSEGNSESSDGDSILCLYMATEEVDAYENSNRLAPSTETLSRDVYTEWEIE